MFSKKTLFVLGAGASKELNMPLGLELRQKIAGVLNVFDPNTSELVLDRNISVVHAIVKMIGEVDFIQPEKKRLHNIVRRMQEALIYARSIDDFLNDNSEDKDLVTLGKIGIAAAIVEAESASLLANPQKKSVSAFNYSLSDTWYVGLSDMLRTNKNDLDSMFDSVQFIDFNYDRCLPVYLHHYLMTYYGVDSSYAEILLRKCKIIHPYGSIGTPFVDRKSTFGVIPERDLHRISQSLKTYSEQVADVSLLNDIGSAFERAEQIIFLGFAYYPQNLRLLGQVGREIKGTPDVFGTRVGISEPNWQTIKKQLREFVSLPAPRNDLAAVNLKCAAYLQEYERVLKS